MRQRAKVLEMKARPHAQTRIIAWLIDFSVACGIGGLFGPLGWVVTVGYWLLRDACFDGSSIGKRLMGLRVVRGPSQVRCRVVGSALRNFLWLVPFANVLMAGTGLYALSKDRAGRHWGDRLADTRVMVV